MNIVYIAMVVGCAVFMVRGLMAMIYRRVGEDSLGKRVSGNFAISCAMNVIGNVIVDDSVWAVVNSALTAYWTYRWWNSGGGDGIKNFLQSLVMKPAYAVK